jgi:protein-histidine pros-kinase
MVPSDEEAAGMFSALLEAAPDAVIVVDGGRINLVNARTESLFGYARDELLGQPVQILVPERFRTTPQAQLVEGERFGLHKDGRELPVEISLRQVDPPDGSRIIAAVRDLTERRRLEQRRSQSSQHKSEVLATMSHDLRTPLNAIMGFAALMQMGKAGPVSATQKEYLEDILSSSQELLLLIDGVLELARSEGKSE